MSGDTGTRVAGWMVVLSLPLVLVGSILAVLPLFSPAAISPLRPTGPELLARLAGGGGIALLGLLLGVVGLALYVLIPAFSGPDRARRDYGSHRTVLASTLFSVILGNVVALLYFVLEGRLLAPGTGSPGFLGMALSPSGIAVAAVSLDIALAAVVYLRVVRPGAIGWIRMGLQREKLGSRLLVGLAFGALLLACSTALEWAMELVGIRQTQAELFASVRGARPVEFLLVLLAGAVIAPVAEEFFFRGFVFRAYLDQKGTVRAFLYSAALFAAMHFSPPAFPPILAMGLLLAFLYYRTGSIIPGIVAHSVNNAAAFFLLYLGIS